MRIGADGRSGPNMISIFDFPFSIFHLVISPEGRAPDSAEMSNGKWKMENHPGCSAIK